jgi:hypothetical protein
MDLAGLQALAGLQYQDTLLLVAVSFMASQALAA